MNPQRNEQKSDGAVGCNAWLGVIGGSVSQHGVIGKSPSGTLRTNQPIKISFSAVFQAHLHDLSSLSAGADSAPMLTRKTDALSLCIPPPIHDKP